jgi:hypothetical protein
MGYTGPLNNFYRWEMTLCTKCSAQIIYETRAQVTTQHTINICDACVKKENRKRRLLKIQKEM